VKKSHSPYGWVDEPLVPNQTYTYELNQQLTHDAWILLATGTTTPYGVASMVAMP
jgi:hypothetical protein